VTRLPALSDPFTVVHALEAWMPEKIAAFKLRGFVHDVGGELIESVPGKIRVRLGNKGCVYPPPRRSFSWFGLAKPNLIEMELRLNRPDPTRDSHLQILVLLKPTAGHIADDEEWRARCAQIYCDLRGYLMGQTGALAAAE
jgi:serine/threonine-protein kinase